jgi:hypothetical protein
MDQDTSTWTMTTAQPVEEIARRIGRFLIQTATEEGPTDKCDKTYANYSVDFQGLTAEFCSVGDGEGNVYCDPSAIRFYDQQPH